MMNSAVGVVRRCVGAAHSAIRNGRTAAGLIGALADGDIHTETPGLRVRRAVEKLVDSRAGRGLEIRGDRPEQAVAEPDRHHALDEPGEPAEAD